MKVSGRFICTGSYISEKGNQGVNLVDLDTGGAFSLSMGKAHVQIPAGAQLKADGLEVNLKNTRYGLMVEYKAGSLLNASNSE
jgi:hypothetical protein